MQFQVPQFIEAEDKIVGPLSLRQFFYIGTAGAICFVLFYTVQTWLAVMLSMILISLGLAFAFVKINGRPLASIAAAAFLFYWKPQRYSWQVSRTPSATKNENVAGAREEALSGASLKHVWSKLQTGENTNRTKLQEIDGRYEVFRRQTGERRIARRVDYR